MRRSSKGEYSNSSSFDWVRFSICARERYDVSFDCEYESSRRLNCALTHCCFLPAAAWTTSLVMVQTVYGIWSDILYHSRVWFGVFNMSRQSSATASAALPLYLRILPGCYDPINIQRHAGETPTLASPIQYAVYVYMAGWGLISVAQKINVKIQYFWSFKSSPRIFQVNVKSLRSGHDRTFTTGVNLV